MSESSSNPTGNFASDPAHPAHHHPGEISVEFGRSVVRLRLRDWVAVGLIFLIVVLVVPMICERCEDSPADVDGRVPYAESEDYWTYRRRIDEAVAAERIPILGDSVVWGDYVTADQTLSAYLSTDLNTENATNRFANGGLNGVHPLALKGLVEHYANDVRNQRVILHCNLLWMSSPDRDLRTNQDIPINHTGLIPQFRPKIPAYHATFAQRLELVINRSVPFFDCVTHLRKRFFDGRDLESWSLAHPYANPLAQFSHPIASDDELRHEPVPWTQQGIGLQDMPWIELKSSLQWEAWRDTANLLRDRRNRVFVLVGPLNEHLLEEASRTRYQALRAEVVHWLQEHNFPHLAPEALPSDEYGDASHPLSAGYARLAQTIQRETIFQKWLNESSDSR